MASYIIQDTTLTDIADAIREKDGGTDPILTENMASRILAIPTGGGGGIITPEYTEEQILDNSSLADSFTFSGDYHNYEMLRVVLYNTSNQHYESQFVVPEGIDLSKTYSGNKINFNMMEDTMYSNQYVAYTISGTNGLSWSRYGRRNVTIYAVYGMTITNFTLTKTVIYSREAIGSAAVTPTPPETKTFFDFDAIMYMSCTGSADETQFARDWYSRDLVCMYGEKYFRRFIKYNNAFYVTITPTSIGTQPYFYVVGLNFT